MLQGLEAKDWVAVVFSFTAFCFSLIGALRERDSKRRSEREQERSFRATLTESLNKLLDTQLEWNKLCLERANDQRYLATIGPIFSQRNGFLLEQAGYVASRIPNLVRTYEWNTLALAHASQLNFDEAQQFYLKAIELAPTETQKGQATRSRAGFLYSQKRIEEGREEYRKALGYFERENNSSYSERGETYLQWAVNELIWNNSPHTAEKHEQAAKDVLERIDVIGWRQHTLASLAYRMAQGREQASQAQAPAPATIIGDQPLLATPSPRRPYS